MLPAGCTATVRVTVIDACVATAAAAAATCAPQVRHAGPSVSAAVAAGNRLRAHSRIVVPSLVVAVGVGTLRTDHIALTGVCVVGAVGRVITGSTLGGGAWGHVGSTLGSCRCAAVIDCAILVVV